MAQKRDLEVTFENVRIVFRNFEGKEKKFNAAGNRNFALVLDDDQYQQLLDDGWNVKTKPPREEGDANFNFLPVTVSYKGRPPALIMLTSRGRTTLDEETAEMLDFAEIENVDLIIRAYDWEVNGNTGRKAYLKKIFVTIHEDDLDLKYANVREIGYDEPITDLDEEFE